MNREDLRVPGAEASRQTPTEPSVEHRDALTEDTVRQSLEKSGEAVRALGEAAYDGRRTGLTAKRPEAVLSREASPAEVQEATAVIKRQAKELFDGRVRPALERMRASAEALPDAEAKERLLALVDAVEATAAKNEHAFVWNERVGFLGALTDLDEAIARAVARDPALMTRTRLVNFTTFDDVSQPVENQFVRAKLLTQANWAHMAQAEMRERGRAQ